MPTPTKNTRLALLPPLPAEAPRFDPGFMGSIARALLRLHGWRIAGEFPPHRKVVMAVFPHTSNWDGYFGILFVLSLGLKISLIIKQSWMKGRVGKFMAWLGFIGVDRTNPAGFASQIAKEFNSRESFWTGVTPEGTRSKARDLKTGFHRIARAAEAVIAPVCIDFHQKCFRVLPAFEPSENVEADTQKLLNTLRGNAWPRHPKLLSTPAREALTQSGELIKPMPPK